MPLIPFGQTFWVITVIVLAVAVGLLTMGVIWSFERRRALLPDATRYENLKDLVAALEVQRLEKDDQLRLLDQKIHDRDRIGAEVAALTERLDNLRAELAALAGAEQQIDEMKQKAADAAAVFAVETAKLDQAKLILDEMMAKVADAQDRLGKLVKEADQLDVRNKVLRETLPEEIVALRAEVVELGKERGGLVQEISKLEGNLRSLQAAGEATSSLLTRIETLEARYNELRAKLPDDIRDMGEELVRRRAELDALVKEISQFRGEHEALLAAREEVSTLAARGEVLKQEIETARKTRDDILNGSEVDDLNHARAKLIDQIGTLKAQWAELEQAAGSIDVLEARKAALEEDVARLRAEAGGAGVADPSSVVKDLTFLPSPLKSVPTEAYLPQPEDEALHAVTQHLAYLDLHYDQRTLFAFHTALKINDASQMTVLAGVSGTGKSLLPRRYAEAMGLHFLQIAVEPRWDSPQDLLGFYNYIEKRYRATDLARTLVQMDPYNTSGLAEHPREDEMMLVLLDEMNLARVEYYFSEFLSRLEVRPRLADAGNPTRRLGASLPIDIPGRPGGPLLLFPSHNVLFAGTMNDDESTQSLSDKVLDRSNVMQFPAPERFVRAGDAKPVPPMSRYRSFGQWQKWIKSAGDLVGGERTKAEEVIGKLARIMEGCGRPFGHRLNEAMLAYVVNYPRDRGMAVDVPLADQVELRILPKLRGLAIDDHKQAFDGLTTLVEQDLRDRGLATKLGNLVEQQRTGTGQFNWRGFNR